jgi:hypothetical protein
MFPSAKRNDFGSYKKIKDLEKCHKILAKFSIIFTITTMCSDL